MTGQSPEPKPKVRHWKVHTGVSVLPAHVRRPEIYDKFFGRYLRNPHSAVLLRQMYRVDYWKIIVPMTNREREN